MDNNNSIPYGTISWDNEDSFSPSSQQREAQRVPSARNLNPVNNHQNGLRYSLRGPQFPAPQQRNDRVGLSRNLEMLNHRQGQPQRNVSNSATSSTIQYEGLFSLRPLQNPSIQMQSNSNEGETFSPSPSSYVNTLRGSSSINAGIASDMEVPSFSTAGVSSDNMCNSNVGIPRRVTDISSHDSTLASRAKRKSSTTDREEGQGGPSTKQFLSEERMAARMHNLRISNDHNYPVNIMQRYLDQFVAHQPPGSSESPVDNDDQEFENNDESTEGRQENLPVFVIPPNVKEALNETQSNSILPEAIFKQLSKPCLAVIPWKSPEDRLNLSSEDNPDDQDQRGNRLSSSNSSSSTNSCTSLVMESCPEAERFEDKGVHHVEIVGECSMFSLEDDDMEP